LHRCLRPGRYSSIQKDANDTTKRQVIRSNLLDYPVVMDGYDLEQRLVTQRTAASGSHETVLHEIFADVTVQYVLVRDHEAGCFDFRVERLEVN